MIIGFVGRLGSGKNTAAERLAKIVDREVEFVAFADKLKRSAAAVFGVTAYDMNAWKNDPTATIILDTDFEVRRMTVREFLQRYGTEAHRDVFGTDFWVDQALDQEPPPVYAGVGSPHLLLVTDVRFPNEVDGIHRRNGYVVEIKGLSDPVLEHRDGKWYHQHTNHEVHASECPLDGADAIIDNSKRGDSFANLDSQLYDLAVKLGLPLKEA